MAARLPGSGARYCHARRVQYSIGSRQSETIVAALDLLPEAAWTPAYDGDGIPRDGAAVAEITGIVDLTSWPRGNTGDRPP